MSGRKRIIFSILCTILIFMLCSCGKKSETQNNNTTASQNNQNATDTTIKEPNTNYKHIDLEKQSASTSDSAYAWKANENGTFEVTYKQENNENYYSPLNKNSTWQCSPLPVSDSNGSYHKLDNVVFFDKNIGAAVVLLDSGMSKSFYDVYYTTDGAKTWKLLIGELKTVDSISHVAFIDKDHIAALCNEGASIAHVIIIDTSAAKYGQYDILDIFDNMTDSKILSINNYVLKWEYTTAENVTEKVETDLKKYIK